MRRRWRLWLIVALLLVEVGVALHPAVYWPVLGWCRGEAFYRGKPTSCWAREIEGSYHKSEAADVLNGDWFYWPEESWYEILENCLPDSSWTKRLQSQRGLNRMALAQNPPLLNHDEAALPVLLELLHFQGKAPRVAIRGILGLGSSSTSALPTLRALTESDDPTLRSAARDAIERIEADERWSKSRAAH